MLVNLKTILDDAASKGYAVIATSAVSMEMARSMVFEAEEEKAPLIFLLGQNMMRQHASAELIVPMLRELSELSSVPIAICLDHGNDEERILYAIKNGFTSIMFDGSLLPLEENIEKTRHITDLAHRLGLSVEGELGHVGVAMKGDEKDTSLYTKAEDAKRFVDETKVDSLAIACGTAHGEYPKGMIPHIAFDVIKSVKEATGCPIALHGGSGSGDENIIKAVEAGINKVNVVTEAFNAARDALKKALDENPKMGYIELMEREERGIREFLRHWISLTKSAGKADGFKAENRLTSIKSTLIITEDNCS